MLIELSLWVTIGGNGFHQKTLSNETMTNFYKIFLSNQFTYFLIGPTIKVSIICFYRRVFTIPTFQRTSFSLNTLIILWGAAIFLACALQCRPLRAYWDPSTPGQCLDDYKLIVVNQIFNVIMDFVILALPIPMIWNLHRTWQDKLALNGVFALGGFVCFASIFRVVVLFWIDGTDMTYTVYQATLWTHIEPSIGLICSCLPTIRGLFPKFKLPSQNKKYRNGAPYSVNTDVSTSHFVATGRKSAAVEDEYIRMEEGVAAAEESIGSRERAQSSSAKTDTSWLDITVRTDIDVRQDKLSQIDV
ncbi:integral membrane protein [Aspergillus sclerotiicarbonarius CBS 121057]|uniref:Integral membrane protein n=1 Tax=Aspergillus sclerotiicarbonarius (strain CBS 121057 / IBT 28362) TaxID=1448318 RepID=A0A319E1D9_ASPSB|nr:integral membrane protein [Aspergillus sclerotiicarbonarius CBS 121057]